MVDIGQILFVEILRMTQYPGSPFTGQIINDLVMFFFIPSVFSIYFINIVLSRMRMSGKMRLLFGLAVYLFIIFGGYYSAFALATGPIFIVLIFLIGVLWFIGHHFRGGEDGGRTEGLPSSALRKESSVKHLPDDIRNMLGIPGALSPTERSRLQHQLKKLDKRIEKLEKEVSRGGSDKAIVHLDELRVQRDAIEERLYGRR